MHSVARQFLSHRWAAIFQCHALRAARHSQTPRRRLCDSHGACGSRENILALLRDRLRFGPEGIQRIFKKNPQLRRATVAEVSSCVATLSKDAGVATDDALASVVRQCPTLLTVPAAQLSPTLACLRAALPGRLVPIVVQACPEVLLRSPEAIRGLEAAFHRMGIPFAKTVHRTPRILMREAHSIQQVYDFFTDPDCGPGFDRAKAARVVGSSPMLLVGARNPQQQLAPLVSFLRKDLQVDPADDACLAFYAWPGALATVETNFRFLVDSCGFGLEDLQREAPSLGYSFEARIHPRARYAHELGCPRPSLRALAAADDRAFCGVVGAKLEEYQEFARALRRSGSAGVPPGHATKLF